MLALNIVILSYAQSSDWDDAYFSDGFMGKENPFIGGGSCYGTIICEFIEEMPPLRNQDFTKYLRKSVYPSLETRVVLGPALTQKVILTAPFFAECLLKRMIAVSFLACLVPRKIWTTTSIASMDVGNPW